MGYSKLISEMKNNSKSWKIVLESPQPESLCLSLMKSYGTFSKNMLISLDPALSPFDALAVLFAFRPDRFAEASIHYLKELFGQDFMAVNDDQNITGFVQEIWKPAFMISEKGHDISYRIEKIAGASNQRLYAIAMGSPENIQQADATLIQASRTGAWLLIKNAHLALSWLVSLDKKLSGMTKKDSKFRLFITCEVHPSLPVNLIRSSKLLLFESATGVKYCAHQSFASIPKSVQLSNPLEKGRLLLMLSWLHAVITERSKYIPIGWSKKYDFSHADFELGVSVIDLWLNQASSGRANISPEKMPWDALQNLISYHIYGSKIDSKMDQHVLDTLTKQILCVESFNSDFILVSKKGAIPAIATPSGTKWDQYLDWIHDLPEEASPHWIGLSPDADLLLKEQEGIRDYVIVFYSLVNSILKNLKSFQALLDENQVHIMSNGATPEKFRSWLRIIPEVRNIQENVDLFFKAFCFVEFRYQNTS
jgi:dynein heavy chain 1